MATEQNMQSSSDTPEAAITRVAKEAGVNPQFLLGLAKLETQVGAKTIKGKGQDTYNLFNIKGQGPKGGITAFDKAEGSNDPYRAYSSYEESARDAIKFLQNKRYAGALQAKDGNEFATILKTGGYATDPNYIAKLSGVIGATVPGAQTAGTPVTVTNPDGTVQQTRLQRDAQSAATMFEGAALRTALQGDAAKFEQQAIDNEPKFEEKPGFTDLVGTAWQDPRVIPTRTILEQTFRAIDGSEDPVVEGWSYFNDRANIEGKLRNQDEIDYVRENGMSSPAALDRAMAEIDNRRRYDAEYAKGGPTLALAAQLTAGLADPASLLAGVGLSKAFQLARIGSGAFIASGRGGAAVAAAGAENALGNLAIEAAADIAGEVKSASDYTLAAVTGAGMSVLFTRGTLRAANEAAQANLLRDMGDKAIADHADVVQQARTALGDDATPEQLQAKVTELQTTQIKADLDEATSTKPYTDDMAVDKDTLALMKDDFEGKPPVIENNLDAEGDALKVDTDTPELDRPVDAKDPVALIEAVRTIETEGTSKPIVRTIQTTEGDALTTTWSYGKKKAGEDTSALTVLTTLSKVNTKMSKVQRVIVDRLAETIKGSPAMTKVNFALSYKRGWYNPANSISGKKAGGAFITTPSGKTSGTENLGAIAANLDGHSLYTVVHEITHAATHAKVEAGRTGKGTAEEIASFQRLDAMRMTMIEKLKAEGTMPKSKKEADGSQGAAYASQNVHEFVAQAYSDAATQKFLSGMKGEGGNALQRFVQEVRNLLGLGKDRTLLDDVLNEIDNMIVLPESSPLKKSNKKVMGIKQLLTESPTFINWFGKSKMFDIVDGVPVPKVFYHGTGWTFKVFDPNVSKSVKASFVSPSSKFAQGFTSTFSKEDFVYDMSGKGHYSLEQIAEFKAKAEKMKASGDAQYSLMSVDGLTKHLMAINAPSGNIMAVFVRAENPFDFENPDQIAAIRSQLIAQKLAQGNDMPYAINFAEDLLNNIKSPKDGSGNWVFFEKPDLQEALKALKHDSWFELEAKTKNLAVYDANQIKSAIGNNGDYSTTNDDILAGALPGPTSSNQAATGASIWLPRIIDHARNWTKKNPVDKKKLATFTRTIGSEGTLGGGYSDGLKLASSQNPVMRMIAGLVIETTTGAAGRRTTAAVAREILHRKFIGNTILDYSGAYAGWAKSQGIGATKRFLNDVNQGDLKRTFDTAVYREILNRRNKLPLTQDPNVKGAADSLEGGFTRMLNEQKAAGVLGGDNLPDNSVGYVPQALDGKKLAVATEAQLRDLEANLAEQFKANTDWDEGFADTFAAYYVKRARDRAMGAKGVDGLAAGHDGLTHIHELLTEIGDDVPALKDAANKAKALSMQKSGLGQTKKRLDIDLTTRLKDGTELLDFYVADPMLLYRQYANRTAGNVALTRQGILGPKGVRQLREAAQSLAGGERATKDELDAFDRVMAEMLGQPDPGGVVSAGATNLRLLVSLQRLGGLAFTQAAETFNAVHHLGLGAVLKGIPDLPRLIGEVRSIKSGRKVKSPLLESIETYSGAEFGAENYKMVAPLDAPDNRLVEYGDTAGLGSRLLNAGIHLQSKVSFFRGLMSAQHRMMAEQIVLKSLRYIAEGKNPAALVDMGFTDRVVNGMKGDLAKAVTYGPDGRIKEFDITKVGDPRVREEFIQAVHRGVSQIIQGTFVGERAAWASNDYAKLFLQLRTFGLTAVEKQWGRTRMNEGYAKAAGLLLGQMALAAPIHLARVQLGAAGREDRDEYLERNLSPGGLVRALMNYSSLSGLTGDILELTTSVAGGWAGEDFKQAMGIGPQATTVGRAIPIAGTVDSAIKVVSGKADLHTAVKQLPFSNLPFLTPIINLTKTED